MGFFFFIGTLLFVMKKIFGLSVDFEVNFNMFILLARVKLTRISVILRFFVCFVLAAIFNDFHTDDGIIVFVDIRLLKSRILVDSEVIFVVAREVLASRKHCELN